MELNRKRIHLILYLLTLNYFLFGCALTGNLINWTDTQSLEEYGSRMSLVIATVHPYIGKTKEEVFVNFGQPTDIYKPSFRSGIKYEEEWEYFFKKGYPKENGQKTFVRFFFNDDIVEEVGAF